jgi:pimeloyl-ACP methyl ester carboxylesterase
MDAFMALVWGPSWRDLLERRVPGGGTQVERDAAATFESDLPALQSWRFDAEDAQRIDGPVLLVSGSASGPLFEEIRDLVHAWFPQTEEELLADANHGFPITHPRELAAALAVFLRRAATPFPVTFHENPLDERARTATAADVHGRARLLAGTPLNQLRLQIAA